MDEFFYEDERSVERGAEGIVWAATLTSGGPNAGLFRDGKAILLARSAVAPRGALA